MSCIRVDSPLRGERVTIAGDVTISTFTTYSDITGLSITMRGSKFLCCLCGQMYSAAKTTGEQSFNVDGTELILPGGGDGLTAWYYNGIVRGPIAISYLWTTTPGSHVIKAIARKKNDSPDADYRIVTPASLSVIRLA